MDKEVEKPKEAEKKQDAKGKKDVKDPVEELTEEELALKQNIELMVERCSDPDTGGFCALGFVLALMSWSVLQQLGRSSTPPSGPACAGCVL